MDNLPIDATEGIAFGSALVLLDSERDWQRRRERAQRRVEPSPMEAARTGWWERMLRNDGAGLDLG